MIVVFRWMLRLTLALLLLAGLALGLVWYLATRSLPDYDATYAVDGITAPVQIVRDTQNVPHIFGPTDARRVLRARLRPCAGPAVADDDAAPHRAGTACPNSSARAR